MNKTRASRDGHEFHEAWAARKALQLVFQRNNLVGIAIEGLSPVDETKASSATVEIADVVLYYGDKPTFNEADSIAIVQLKYSISSDSVPFRVSDARKTITKFAAAFRNHKKNYGENDVEDKLFFEMITNRPIYSYFLDALKGLVLSKKLSGETAKQAKQIIAACNFEGEELIAFIKKLKITGSAGSLNYNKQELKFVLADWSAAPDAMARARLGSLRELLRNKAGSAGEQRNVITKTDVIDALGLQSVEDLFPCPASFPEVGRLVEREQFFHVTEKISALENPLIIHADGGVGKTVFFQSLANAFGEAHETILFDCFGGGAYRAPEDARHLPKRGLIHIINSLACQGLCDPLLPEIENVADLIRAFRIRLEQSINTLKRGTSKKQILIFIDAIDNAAEHAKDNGELAFPTLLLESFYHKGPIEGVRLIVSCRTYRRDISRGDIPQNACDEIKLEPFTFAEAQRYLLDRIPTVTDSESCIAFARSQGIPRILEHLALSDRGLLDPSEINNVLTLDSLLRDRITDALEEALKRGYKEANINAFLAGLAILPPPVPLNEYAEAHGLDISVVKSFANDLSPLLEQTSHGLMFRDEPTETLIREEYASKAKTLGVLADNLYEMQDRSVYAAITLPVLLQKIEDGQRLFELAYDERFPHAITSVVGKQKIRYSRLKAAVLYAAKKKDFNNLVHLLLELSTLAAVNQRGKDYILDNPDLVIASHDIDATRRLFEIRSQWPGTRHARLIIASVLAGDLSSACRHVENALDWFEHYANQNEDYHRETQGPTRLDVASIPLSFIAQGRADDAALFMERFKPWYVYEVAEHLFKLLNQSEKMGVIPRSNIHSFINSCSSNLGVSAAALSFVKLDNLFCKDITTELANACDNVDKVETNKDFHSKNFYQIQDGLLKAVTIGISMQMNSDVLKIASLIAQKRPRTWYFTDRAFSSDIYVFVIFKTIQLFLLAQPITDSEFLPEELNDIVANMPDVEAGSSFRKALKIELDNLFNSQRSLPNDKQSITYNTKIAAERFIDERMDSLTQIAKAFSAVISSNANQADEPFFELLKLWKALRVKREYDYTPHETNRFFDSLGLQLLIFSLWTRNDLAFAGVNSFLNEITEDGVASKSILIEVISIISMRPDLSEAAGKAAIKTKRLIELEDDVNSRASSFAHLSRAILLASFDETAAYFLAGLDQLDVIGSGDYQFTNELLTFSSALIGNEIEDADFHTLSNICELNMSDDAHKFPWWSFAQALSGTSGYKSLAKLCRWHDRDKISLNYTLLPYLTALIKQDKIDPTLSLALLRLSDSVELHVCSTDHLALAIEEKQYSNARELLSELFSQFQKNHLGFSMPGILLTFMEVIEKTFGENSDENIYLSSAAPKLEKLILEQNDYHNSGDLHSPEKIKIIGDNNEQLILKLALQTNPFDPAGISSALEALNGTGYLHSGKPRFFEKLRAKLTYSERSKYILCISKLEELNLYSKLAELTECKKLWSSSSISLGKLFQDIGIPLVRMHADDFINDEYMSTSSVASISEISGIPIPLLTVELITIYAAPDTHLPAPVWMSLASNVCPMSEEGEGQSALKRLLNSGAAKLASTVVDGAWEIGLYPKKEQVNISGGMIWFALGSPSAEDRWRAAHSVRCLSRFGRWDVIDVIVGKFMSTDAHPYQAPELPFYFLHARLWLLIAIARMSIEYPNTVAKYANTLKAIALSKDFPHILFRHFAAQALLNCAHRNSIALSRADINKLITINHSLLLKIKCDKYSGESFYQERSDSIPETEPTFRLDYDFHKTDVANMSEIFGKSSWETNDAMTAWVRKFDATITSMHESGGRSDRHVHGKSMNGRYHTYGQHLGWHSLYLVAGEFLEKYPVVQRAYHDNNDDAWMEWFKHELLTRDDGLWLSDGVDRQPVDALTNLREKIEKEIVITGNKAKLLSLLKIEPLLTNELVVAGDWCSMDGVNIHITSALAPSNVASSLAMKLSKEDPFQAWLPRMEAYDDGEEYSHSKKLPFEPWIVCPQVSINLDDNDPLGVNTAARRLRLVKAINQIGSLSTSDPFKRNWVNSKGKIEVRSEVWGSNRVQDDETLSAERLICTSDFLKTVLLNQKSHLILFITLRRYEKGYGSQGGRYWHSTAAVQIKESLDFEYYPGVINQLHTMKF